MRITSTGHAGLLLETAAGRIVCDPWGTPACSPTPTTSTSPICTATTSTPTG
jgi:L-ascorbate metabolism protein UlaG (beta-lactamase superfamily)